MNDGGYQVAQKWMTVTRAAAALIQPSSCFSDVAWRTCAHVCQRPHTRRFA